MSDGGYYDKALGGWLPNDLKCYCDNCGEEVENEDELNEVWFENYVCDNCYVDYIKCDNCGHEVNDDLHQIGIEDICDNCYDEYVRECAICGTEYLNEDEDVLICAKCFKELPE